MAGQKDEKFREFKISITQYHPVFKGRGQPTMADIYSNHLEFQDAVHVSKGSEKQKTVTIEHTFKIKVEGADSKKGSK